MDREEVLQKSRQENAGKMDECEKTAFGLASRVGMLVGGLLCVVLVLIGEFVLHRPELSLVGWLVYFAMQGTSNLVLYSQLKTRFKLIYGIVELLFAVAFAVATVLKVA